eukprot:PhF_6_TR32161/c0_g1_i1/m.47706/K14769/UTP11; U3 small nucleolar RNA-associated protein 11
MTKGKGSNPGAGGLKKHLNLKDHKERQQPKARRHLGSLEKHKDYKERARIHHIREDKIQELRKKAAEKNEEEFNFGMIRGREDFKGRHVQNATEANRTTAEQRSLNSSDLRFLEWRKRQVVKKLLQEVSPGDSRVQQHSSVKFVYEGENDQQTPEATTTETKGTPTGEAQGEEAGLESYVDLNERLGKAISGLRMEQNLISKGRRKLVMGNNGEQHYRWSAKRSR